MNTDPKEIIVLGTIRAGIKKFEKIQKIRHINSKEADSILEQLENKGFVKVEEKKGFLGIKIEIEITYKGYKEIEKQVNELQTKWNQMSTVYKTQNKEELKQYMDDSKSFFPMMIFFGVTNIEMFSMMFEMIGMKMSNYVPPENIPEGADIDEDEFDKDVGV